MNLQRVAAVVRQVAAVVALVMGVLTQALSSIKLPPAGSAVLGFAGVAIVVAEHIVSALSPASPSTSSPPPPPPSSPPPPPPAGTK